MIQVVKMAEDWLSFEQRKFMLRWWWMVGKCALSAEMVDMWIWNSRQLCRSCCQNFNGLAQPSRQQLWWPLVSVLIAGSCATKLMVVILNTCSRLAGLVSASLMRIMFCLVECLSFSKYARTSSRDTFTVFLYQIFYSPRWNDFAVSLIMYKCC